MSVTKNYIYNLLYQILLIMLPIITVPYVSRVLGAEGIGINAFTASITQYFLLIGTLGVSLYGNRIISYVRDDINKRSKTFWQIFYLRLVTSLISVILYVIFIFNISSHYRFYLLLQGISFLYIMFEVSWFFTALEDFKKIVMRNFIIKIIGVILILLLVKSPKDLWIYIIILCMSNFLGELILWFYLPKQVVFIKLKDIAISEITTHLKPIIIIFIPQVSITIYAYLDKLMLGILNSDFEVGLYENSQKVIKICLAVATSLGIVLLPKIANLYYKKDFDKINEYISKSYRFVNYISIPMLFGFFAISQTFAIVFFGKEFAKAGTLMYIISPIILITGWNNVLGVQYLLPFGKEKKFTISVVVGAIINIICNLILLPPFKSIGACISTVIGEFSVFIILAIMCSKTLPIRSLYKSIWKDILSASIMFFIIKQFGFLIQNQLIRLVFQVIFAVFLYFGVQVILKSEINWIVVNKIITLFKIKEWNCYKKAHVKSLKSED